MDSYKERKYAQNPNLLYLQYVEENSTLQTEMRISIVSILCEIHPKKRKHTHTYTDKRRIKILTVINSRLKPESIAIKKIQLCVRYARTRTHTHAQRLAVASERILLERFNTSNGRREWHSVMKALWTGVSMVRGCRNVTRQTDILRVCERASYTHLCPLSSSPALYARAIQP